MLQQAEGPNVSASWLLLHRHESCDNPCQLPANCLPTGQKAPATSKGSRPKAKGIGKTCRQHIVIGSLCLLAKAIGTGTGTGKDTGNGIARAEATVKAKAKAQAGTAQSQSDWIAVYLSPGQDVTLKHRSILSWLLMQRLCFILRTVGGGGQLCGAASWSLHDILH